MAIPILYVSPHVPETVKPARAPKKKVYQKLAAPGLMMDMCVSLLSRISSMEFNHFITSFHNNQSGHVKVSGLEKGRCCYMLMTFCSSHCLFMCCCQTCLNYFSLYYFSSIRLYFLINWTLVCRRPCRKGLYEILMEFIQLNFFKCYNLPLANSWSEVNNCSHFCFY